MSRRTFERLPYYGRWRCWFSAISPAFRCCVNTLMWIIRSSAFYTYISDTLVTIINYWSWGGFRFVMLLIPPINPYHYSYNNKNYHKD
jgi:hypothetical protein